MDNPWRTLGVSGNATEDEIKKAYRQLARIHHPDRFANSPQKAAEEKKMQEINEAYNYLMRHGSNARSAWAGDRQANTGGNPQNFQYIRQIIQNGNLAMAEQLLDGMAIRSAEWHFLRGICYMRRNWYIQARNEIGQAVSMDPNNKEYRQAYEQFVQTNQQYRTQTQAYRPQSNQDELCQICSTLYCLDCCCEGLGGDCIPCC